MNRTERKINNFISALYKSGVLDWSEKLKSKFPNAEVYLVGGAVRDAILKKSENKDLDFVVRNVEMEKLEKFLSKLGWIEKLGKTFGVLKFIPKEFKNQKNFEPLDIALPRSEFSTSQGGYKDFEVKFDKNLEIKKDLLRRDFTINAIAVLLTHLNLPFVRGEINIVDPFSGIQDIKNKIIQCVGKSEERLSEDYTRILRAIRFACQLNFQINSKTQKVIKKLVVHLNDKDSEGNYISPREVIAKQFLKALDENHLQAIELFDKLEIFKILMPEILKMKKCPQPEKFHSEGDVWVHTLLSMKNLNSKKFKKFEKKLNKLFENQNSNPNIQNKLELIIALLLHDIGKPPTLQTPKKNGTDRIRFNDHNNVGASLSKEICERLKLSAPEKYGIDCENISWLIQKHMMLVNGHPSQFRPNTIEKYFFNPNHPGQNLIKLAWLDTSATILKKGKLKQELVHALLKRIKSMKSLVKQKKDKAILPEPFLNGDEIMKILNLPAGREVGEIKNQLREKQLIGEIKDKKSAEEFISNISPLTKGETKRG